MLAKRLLSTLLLCLSFDPIISIPKDLRPVPNNILDVILEDGRFSRLIDILGSHQGLAGDLTDPRQEVTFLAPIDSAFEKIQDKHYGRIPKEQIQDLLDYHVLPGAIDTDLFEDKHLFETLLQSYSLKGHHQHIRVIHHNGVPYLNDRVQIIDGDLEATNGYVHAVDELLTLPPSIHKVIRQFDRYHFSILVSALSDTRLFKTIESKRGITGFLPTNNAFRSLGCRNLKYLFSSKGEEDLERLLEYHFSPKIVYTTELNQKYRFVDMNEPQQYSREIEIPTLLGNERISLKAKRLQSGRVRVKVNDYANVIYDDAITENGVLHVIDSVLIPEDLDLPDPEWMDDEYCDEF
ncbi:hypothetical protein K7432_007193 [Basidiobolus ranarum]|uniref:FAS1 domain-containing protein n=1 Tax=Basidiobolus ranarum TaxID=34480 RepID=A0ABR2W0H7_9FUNG